MGFGYVNWSGIAVEWLNGVRGDQRYGCSVQLVLLAGRTFQRGDTAHLYTAWKSIRMSLSAFSSRVSEGMLASTP